MLIMYKPTDHEASALKYVTCWTRMTIDMSMRLTCGKMLPRTHIMRQPPPADNNDDAGDNTGDN